MRLRVTHRTRYRYERPVTLCHSHARLQPRATERQRCVATRLAVNPEPATLTTHADIYGNPVTAFSIEVSHRELDVCVTTEVELAWPDLSLFATATPDLDAARTALAHDADSATIEARAFQLPSRSIPDLPDLRDYAAPSFPRGRPVLEAVRDLNRRIHAEFAFDSTATTVTTPLAEVLKLRRGVCQDFAHLAVGCVRAMGLPARYVSGYVETLPPSGAERLIGADASHAWIAVYVPGPGWCEFDPTNDLDHCDRHVTLAWGRDYSDVAPLRGVIEGGGAHELEVAVDVVRLAPLETVTQRSRDS